MPIGYLIIRALEADPATIQRLLVRPRNAQLLQNTLLLAGGVTAFSTIIALPLAWLCAASDLKGRRLLTVLAVAPLAVPGYVMAYALLGLGGNHGIAAQLFGLVIPRPRGFWGATIALTLYTYPYLFLNLRAALLGLDPSLIESARSLGYSAREVFWRVVVPQLRPALLAGWLIIVLYTLGDFGAVTLMGYEVFSYAIYLQYAAAFDRVYAAWLALMLLSLTLIALALEARLLGQRRYSRVGSGVARRLAPVRLGCWRYPAYLFIALVVALSLGLPALILSYWLLLAPPQLNWLQLAGAFMRSAGAAAPAALLAAALALPIAYLSTRYPSPLTRWLERLGYLGYALPPIALALAMVFFALRSARWLYQTHTLLVIALALNFLALAIGPIRSALLQHSARLEEAARSLGYRPLAVFWRITLPLLWRGLAASLVLVFVMGMKELPITFLLAPTGYTTLAMSVFSRTSEAMLAEAAPFAAAIVLFSSLFVGVILNHERH